MGPTSTLDTPPAETDLKIAAEVVQGAPGSQEAPGQNRSDLFTHCVEVSDEAVRHLRRRRYFVNMLL